MINGFRQPGPRKNKMIKKINNTLEKLSKVGIDSKYALKYVGLESERKINATPTKKFSGINSELLSLIQ